MADQPQDLAIAEELAHQLVRLFTMTSRAKMAQFSPAPGEGIERAAYTLLAHLVREGPKRITALAEAVRSDTSTVSRQTSSLVAHGLVERKADPEDGRACLLVATAEGRGTFHRAKAERTRHLAALLADWPPGERRMLVRLLERFTADLENYHPVGDPR